MHIRYILSVPRFTQKGTPYMAIVYLREFDPREWQSEAHMRRRFLDLCKRNHAEDYKNPSKTITREEVNA